MEYASDRSLSSRHKLSRIFIEPPDESTSTYEDSDDDLYQTKLNVNCEVILRSGKRLKPDRSSVNSSDDNRKQCHKRKLPEDACISDNKRNKSETNSICDNVAEKGESSVNTTNASINVRRIQCRTQLKEVRTNDNRKNNNKTNSICDSEPETEKENSNKKVTSDFVWIDDVSMPMETIFPVPNYTDCSELSAYEQFEKFFDNDLLQLIVKESSNYAIHLCKPDPKITVAELKVYIAILIMMRNEKKSLQTNTAIPAFCRSKQTKFK